MSVFTVHGMHPPANFCTSSLWVLAALPMFVHVRVRSFPHATTSTRVRAISLRSSSPARSSRGGSILPGNPAGGTYMVWCSTLWTGSEAAQSARRRSRRLRAGRSIARSCRPLRGALSLRVVLRGDHAIASSASVSWRCVAGPVSLGRSCRWLVSCTAAMGTGMKQCVCQAYCCVPRVSGACPRPRHTRFERARRAARCSRRTAR